MPDLKIPSQYPQIQDQVSQLYCKFNAPLTAEEQVDTQLDLVDLQYVYDYKLVWVKDQRTFYYLKEGLTGQVLTDWQKWGSSAQIFPYNNTENYDPNICVHYNGALYVSISPTTAGTLPTNTTYWVQVSGSNATIQVSFTNQSTVLVDVFIKSPIFAVYVNDSPINAFIVKTTTPGSLGGFIWRIEFEENQLPKPLTGYIIIK